MKFRTICLYILICTVQLPAQERHRPDTYHSHDDVNDLLRSWAENHKNICRSTELAESPGGIKILALEVAAVPGNGVPPDSRTALLVVANLEGVHQVGTETALAFIQRLIDGFREDAQITELLNTRTVYVAPMLNPDGAAGFVANPTYETWINATPNDDDDDGKTDEDGADDLNGDGYITLMRVPDPAGKWIIDPDEPRLLLPTDSNVDHGAKYTIHTEGKDDDRDGLFNEDPLGGVRLDRNFPHYRDYHRGTIRTWPDASEETEALLEYMNDRPNIGVVLNLSSQNGALALLHPPSDMKDDPMLEVPKTLAHLLHLEVGKAYARSEILEKMKIVGFDIDGEDQRSLLAAQITGLESLPAIHPDDRDYLQQIYVRYGETLGTDFDRTQILPGNRSWGDFSVYSAMRYGVSVIGSGIWSIPQSSDASQIRGCEDNPVKSVLSNRLNRDALAWSDRNPQQNGFIPWTPVDHPDLENAEVGGFRPYFKIHPESSHLNEIIDPHINFFIDLLAHLPQALIDRVQVTAMADRKYRIRATFINPGWFPTATSQGLEFRSSFPMVARIRPSAEQMIWSGEPFEEFPAIAPGKSHTVEWIVQGPRGSTLPLWISSLKVGTDRTEVELR